MKGEPYKTKQPRFLLVDDVPENLRAMQAMLVGRGYELLTASSGDEALRILLQDQDFSAVLLDVQMPGMTGFETLERMRASVHGRRVPVIFVMSAATDEQLPMLKPGEALVDYVFKPLDGRILSAKLAVFAELYRNRLDAASQQGEALVEATETSGNERTSGNMDAHLHLLSRAYEESSEGLSLVDPRGTILAVNPAFSAITGFSGSELIGRPAHMLYSDLQSRAFLRGMLRSLFRSGVWSGEIRSRSRDGEVVSQWVRVQSIRDAKGQADHYMVAVSGSGRLARDDQRLYYMAHYDALTGLPNRELFRTRLQQAIAQASRKGYGAAVLLCDLDRFKDINDSFGHAMGDSLLKAISHRLRGVIRDADTLSRQAGDEFMILLNEIQQPQDAARVAEKILCAAREPVMLDGQELYAELSVGISVFPDDGNEVDTLIKHADASMYQAKAIGRNTFRFHAPGQSSDIQERLMLENALRRALVRDELTLWYQPQIDLHDGRMVGCEALMRWQSDTFGPVSPDRFIPMAEQTGLIHSLGDWALNEACGRNRYWRDLGLEPGCMAVNLSARQFQEASLLNKVRRAVEDHRMPAQALELELTESALVDNTEQGIATLQSLRDLGVQQAIDDFGTGYSSLNYLKRFPITRLKIDRSFVSDITESSADLAIARTIVQLGHHLGLAVVAEGVETESQLHVLRGMNCDQGQGYLFSRPLSEADMRSYIAARASSLSVEEI